MSNSPKYTNYQISEEVRRRQREERERRRRERAAQRAAEAERRRRERLQRRYQALQAQVSQIHQELSKFASSPAGSHVEAELTQLKDRLQRIAGQLQAEEKVLANAEKELDRSYRELRQVIAAGEAAYEAKMLQQHDAALLELKYQLRETWTSSYQYNPEGLQRLSEMIREVEEALSKRTLTEVQQHLKEAQQYFQRHRQLVEERQAEWLQRHQQAEAALAQLQEEIVGLLADPLAQRWETVAVQKLAQEADQLHRLIENGQFDLLLARTQQLRPKVKEILQRAEQRQEAQDQEDYLTKSILAAVQACGFQVDEIAVGPDGQKTIRTSRPQTDQRVTLQIPKQGGIYWYVNGFPMETVLGSQGQPARVCDEAVTQIEAIQEQLAQWGIETSELTWPGKDPNLPRKGQTQTRPRCQQTKTRHRSQK
ncbi:MAG: hypothetical protein NZ602_17460 [Thermoguttaceae bacterium]|nr:hypothetical protein [Thermoguttaceae bacterium]MDW8038391.1 hypothetical protein [Thermoguttaceae bacterium]